MEATLLDMIRIGENLKSGPQSVLYNIPNPQFVLPNWKKAVLDMFARIKVIQEMRILHVSYSVM